MSTIPYTLTYQWSHIDWTVSFASSQYWWAIAMSSTGQYQSATGGGYIWTTSNGAPPSGGLTKYII